MEFSTTTVSSVAVQAGDSKIVIAVIKVSRQLPFILCGCRLLVLLIILKIPQNQQYIAYRK